MFIYKEMEDTKAKELGGRYIKGKKAYRFPALVHSLRELYKHFPTDAAIVDLGKKHRNHFEKVKQLKEREDCEGDPRLRPYQRVDLDFLKRLKHCAIFWEMRLGKTPLTIRLIEENEYRAGIFVVPATLLYTWEAEIKKWSSRECVVIRGDKKRRKKLYQKHMNREDLIISYETLRNDVDEFVTTQFDFMVLDEAHKIKNHKIDLSKAVYSVGGHSNHRIALTGTPASNKLHELFGILHFVNPGLFPSYWGFVERYFTIEKSYAHQGKEVGALIREKELLELLYRISVQRKQSEVLHWLPEKTYQTITVPLGEKQQKHYDEMLEYYQTGEVDTIGTLDQLMRLRQICTCPELLNLDCENAKQEALIQYIEENKGKPILVFSCFSSYLMKLHAHLYKDYRIHTITGKVSVENRQKYVDMFQRGDLDILLCNIQAAGVGLTLDKADTAIFLDRHFNPALNDQAESRIVPTTKEKAHGIHIIDITTRDTVDARINNLLLDKIHLTKSVNNYRDYLFTK